MLCLVLSNAGVARVLEGELENEDDLIVLVAELAGNYDAFGWNFLKAGTTLPRFGSTFEPDVFGANHGVIDFDTEFDWETRHWQYINTPSDRRYDFVNFRDKQVSLQCPHFHNLTQIKHLECVGIWQNITVDLSDPVINWVNVTVSHFETKSTVDYEACLVEHAQALQRYEDCVRGAIPDFDALAPWYARVSSKLACTFTSIVVMMRANTAGASADENVLVVAASVGRRWMASGHNQHHNLCRHQLIHKNQ